MLLTTECMYYCTPYSGVDFVTVMAPGSEVPKELPIYR